MGQKHSRNVGARRYQAESHRKKKFIIHSRLDAQAHGDRTSVAKEESKEEDEVVGAQNDTHNDRSVVKQTLSHEREKGTAKVNGLAVVVEPPQRYDLESFWVEGDESAPDASEAQRTEQDDEWHYDHHHHDGITNLNDDGTGEVEGVAQEHSYYPAAGEEDSGDAASTAHETSKLLFECIPYCHLGDEAVDSLVLSTLYNGNFHADSSDPWGNTLLILACQYANEEIVKILLEELHANANAQNEMGATGLHFACFQDSLSVVIVEMLLERGADIGRVEHEYGCSPLHYAGNFESSLPLM